MLQKQFKFRTVKEMHALNYNSFTLTVAIIGVGIYSIEAGGYNVFDSHGRDMYLNSHSQGTCVLLEVPSMHKLIQNFQTLYTCRNEYINVLKGVRIANIEDDLVQGELNTVACQMLIVYTNVVVNSVVL